MREAEEIGLTAQDLPDLLHPAPTARLDFLSLERALDFAFASGGTETPLGTCLDHAKNVVSTWDPAGFERDMFVAELVKKAFPIHVRGATLSPSQHHLRHLLVRPPADPEIVRFRQSVLAELTERPALRTELEELYLSLLDFQALLGPTDMGEEPQINRRRIDTLAKARDIVLAMAGGFVGATSALSRLRSFGEKLRDTGAFRRLSSLLDFESNMAGIDVRLGIGHDGTLRSFEIVKIDENAKNPFHRSPMLRLWQRIVRFVRGYRFREDELLEELIDGVFMPLRGELVKLFQLTGDIEFYLAGLGFADVARARGLATCLPEITAPTRGNSQAFEKRLLEGLFNPLLLAEMVGDVIPCSLAFDRHDAIVVLSGPNSGGKTRLLQTLAITQMLGQAGLFVPAARARLVWVEGLFVSLIEDARADQREGRLGMELLRIRQMFERLRPGGLVMLDELCSGTNPSEGEEIFQLVVSLLSELEPQAFITTHFLDFASRLSRRGEASLGEHPTKLEFLQVELDDDEEPTYQFVPGVATTSLAGKTAARLGVTREELERLVEKSRRAHRAQSSTETAIASSAMAMTTPPIPPRVDREADAPISSDRGAPVDLGAEHETGALLRERAS